MNYLNSLIEIELNKTLEQNEICLISREKLVDPIITLDCGHKYNYISIYQELLQKKKKNSLEASLNSNQIKCPYCRKINNGLIPYFEMKDVKKVYGINHPKKYIKLNNKCDWIFKTGQKKNACCNKPCYYKQCNTHLIKETIIDYNSKDETYLKKLTIPILKKIIKNKKIKGYSKMNKKQLINLLISN